MALGVRSSVCGSADYLTGAESCAVVEFLEDVTFPLSRIERNRTEVASSLDDPTRASSGLTVAILSDSDSVGSFVA